MRYAESDKKSLSAVISIVTRKMIIKNKSELLLI